MKGGDRKTGENLGLYNIKPNGQEDPSVSTVKFKYKEGGAVRSLTLRPYTHAIHNHTQPQSADHINNFPSGADYKTAKADHKAFGANHYMMDYSGKMYQIRMQKQEFTEITVGKNDLAPSGRMNTPPYSKPHDYTPQA